MAVDGGPGDDQIIGGTGDGPASTAGPAPTTSRAASGNDLLVGSTGRDLLSGGTGSDELNGGEDSDELNGDAGDDVINGNQGNDRISGGDGNDRLVGEGGRDPINAGSGADGVDSGEGSDVVDVGDGQADTVTCGPGGDGARGDALDRVELDCERLRDPNGAIVRRGPASFPAPPVTSTLQPLDPSRIVRVTGVVRGRRTQLQSLSVRAPSGSRVESRCRGRGCPLPQARDHRRPRPGLREPRRPARPLPRRRRDRGLRHPARAARQVHAPAHAPRQAAAALGRLRPRRRARASSAASSSLSPRSAGPRPSGGDRLGIGSHDDGVGDLDEREAGGARVLADRGARARRPRPPPPRECGRRACAAAPTRGGRPSGETTSCSAAFARVAGRVPRGTRAPSARRRRRARAAAGAAPSRSKASSASATSPGSPDFASALAASYGQPRSRQRSAARPAGRRAAIGPHARARTSPPGRSRASSGRWRCLPGDVHERPRAAPASRGARGPRAARASPNPRSTPARARSCPRRPRHPRAGAAHPPAVPARRAGSASRSRVPSGPSSRRGVPRRNTRPR